MSSAAQMFASVSSNKLKAAAKKMAALTAVEGVHGRHTYSEDEKVAFSEHFNNCFGEDEFCTSSGLIPIDPTSDELFTHIGNGIILCKLVNLAARDTIDERTVNFPKPGKKLNPWEVKENMNLVINSAKSIGCSIVNVHAGDLTDAKGNRTEYIVLGTIWQLIKLHLLAAVNLKEVPELVVLLAEGEELHDLLKLDPESILLRWINFHLARSGYSGKVSNFSSDLADGAAYTYLLSSIEASSIDKAAAVAAEAAERATMVVAAAKDKLSVPAFIQPGDIVRASKRLNLAFCAQIFNTNHGLQAKEEEISAAMEAAVELDEDVEGEGRESKAYRMWLNSLNLGHGNPDGGYFIRSMEDSFLDGICLLEALEKVEPGCTDGVKYVRDPKKLNNFERVANCNKAIDVCKKVGLSVTGWGGRDIADGNNKALLAILSQLMRHHVVGMLKRLGGGKPPKDSEIVAWANETVAASGTDGKITNFRDKSMSSGVFLLQLLQAVESRAVNPSVITTGETDEDKKANARYIVSVARKIGAQVFLSWEDIVEVKPKMMMQLVAGIMYVAKGGVSDE